MNSYRRCGWPIVVAVLLGLVAVDPPDATAQIRAAPASQPPSTWVGGPQLKAFAAMVDEPEALVLQRLSLLPDLVPLAMAAGEVRMDRGRSLPRSWFEHRRGFEVDALSVPSESRNVAPHLVVVLTVA